MRSRRITFSLFLALLTFSIGVAVADFLPKQIVVPQETQALPLALPLKENSFEFSNSQSSKLFEIPKAQNSPLKERAFPDVEDTKVTVAGKLEIISTDFLEWKIVLDGKQIFADGDLPPQIVAQITRKVSPFDEVIVFMQESGNCCEFGRFWFFGLKSDGSYHFSKPIGDGFAGVPKISVGKNYVKVKVRGGLENHGEFYLPGGEWIFKNGHVRKVK
ncbi:MAG: hypothetical protein ACR2GD_08170 [Pyrinomonadaceae bacterium]